MADPDLNLKPIDFDPFSGPEIVKAVPAIEPQVEIWVSCLIGGDDANRSYNESVSLYFHGIFNYEAMERSLQDLVKRHEALRSGFSADGKQLCIFKTGSPEYNFQDISSFELSKQKSFIDYFLKSNAQTPFDLVNGPLFKTTLFKLDDNTHYLTISAHHIICDGWSLGIIMQDLGKLYSAYAKNETPSLPEAPSFSKYAEDQKKFLRSEEYKIIEEYWIDQYAGEVPVLDIPTDYPRPKFKTFKSQRDDYSLSPELVKSIKSIGAKAGCSFVTTLLVAYEVFLHRISGQDDIVLGIPAAGQSATGNYGMVGNCVNLLPLKSHHNDELSFLEFLGKRKGDILDAYDHQQFTFGTLLKKLNIARDASRVPLVPVIFNVDVGMEEGVNFEGLTYDLISNKRDYENFEIFLNATSSGDKLLLEWSYNTQLFKPETIKQMMDDFEFLLNTIVKEPEIKIKDIRLADFHELESKLLQWNDTAVDYPKDKALHHIIADRATEFSNKTALTFHDQSVSYKSLNDQANQLAALLIQNNVQVGDTIGLLSDRSPEMLICLLAIMKSGAAYVTLDPEYPNKRIEYMLADSSAKILLTSAAYHGKFVTTASEIVIEDAWKQMASFLTDEPVVRVDGNDVVYIMYTSGSSGLPKGTPIEHHSLVNILTSIQQNPGINASDKLLAVATISFDIAGIDLYLPLIAGAEIILADTETTKDGRALLDLLNSSGATFMQATPSTWRMLLDSGWESKLNIRAISTGEALPKDLANKLFDKCTELWNMYGPTETTIWSSLKQITSKEEAITLGRPVNNTQIYILDQSLKSVPLGISGEVYIAGDGLARGYLNKSELTERAFIANPFSDEKGSRMYRTGDLGKFTEGGEILYLGRIDNQVKIRGHRIELGSIEDCLNMQKGVKEAVVIVREDRPGDQRLVGYVVPNNPTRQSAGTDDNSGKVSSPKEIIASPEQIAAWKQGLKDILPSYMVPGQLVALKKLPLTPNGKIDKAELPKPETATNDEKVKIMPRTDVEKRISTIWANALGLESVGLYDDFFELGGHSLIAVQVMYEIEKETGIRLPLATLFNSSTVEEISLLLGMDSKAITWDSLVPIKPHGTKPPLYIVHGAGLNVLIFNALAKNMDPDQPVYGLQAKGLNGVDEPLEKIEDMATYYISEILNQNPDGPYSLAGYSFGGIIAFEMAKQLKAMGKQVNTLAMFDTYAYQSDRTDPLFKKIIYRSAYFVKESLFTLSLLAKNPKRTFEYKSEMVKRRLTQLYWKLKYGKEHKQEGFFGYDNSIDEKNQEAWENYILTPYDGKIELFRAKERTFYMEDFEYLGWRPYALGGVNIHEMEGEHNYIFAPPNDKIFARILQNCLNNSIKVIFMALLYISRHDICYGYL
jgi:amino acid adenylation domain-containing protein